MSAALPDRPAAGPGRALVWACLAAAVLGWGVNWPAVKVLLGQWPPLFARGTAGVSGALALALAAAAAGESLRLPPGIWPRLLRASFLNVFAWMGLSTVALRWLAVGECALLVYTMPIWAMLLSGPLAGLRPTGRQVAALVLAFSGVAVLLSGQGIALGPGKGPGIALAIAAAILFAIGNTLGRDPLPLPPIANTAWQVGLGCLPMAGLGLLFEHGIGALGVLEWACWAYMAFLPMGACYLAWFTAVRWLPAGTATLGTLLIPVIGVISAALWLGEPLGGRQVLSLALVIGGVALALGSARGR